MFILSCLSRSLFFCCFTKCLFRNLRGPTPEMPTPPSGVIKGSWWFIPPKNEALFLGGRWHWGWYPHSTFSGCSMAYGHESPRRSWDMESGIEQWKSQIGPLYGTLFRPISMVECDKGFFHWLINHCLRQHVYIYIYYIYIHVHESLNGGDFCSHKMRQALLARQDRKTVASSARTSDHG